jgi:hypothetical protein
MNYRRERIDKLFLCLKLAFLRDLNSYVQIRAKKGPFGYYLQLGEDGKRKQFFKIPVV